MYLPLTSTCLLCVQENGKIMLDNLNKAAERSGKLGDLDNRADELLEKVIVVVYGYSPNGTVFLDSLLPLNRAYRALVKRSALYRE
jgi:hypothetical protein